MANLKKRIPVRQLSLQSDRPKTSQERKKSLTKQFSEDLTDFHHVKLADKEVGIRISLSAKNRTKDQEPPPVKIAWTDDKKSPIDEVKDSGILIKKCPGIKRTQSPAKTRQNSMEKGSILYSRLGQVLKDQNTNKTNLNIILTHTTAEHKQGDILADVSNTDRLGLKPKIMLPLRPEVMCNGDGIDDNMKNVFQTHIRRAVRQKSVFDDSMYTPSRTEAKSSTIVVPVIDAKASVSPFNQKPKIMLRKHSQDDENSVEMIKRSSRPSTAASAKREMFQKRANSAFNAQITRKEPQSAIRPPLVRTASVPVKPELAKPKFIATKRRVRTAKAKYRYEKDSDEESSVGSSRRRGTLQRCVSAAGVLEVVTMVSLVSPSGSENEDEDLEVGEQKSQGVKVQETAAINAGNKAGVKLEEPGGNNGDVGEKNFSLRKTVKSVSFQPSSIHAVRSFSASFPGRRCSMAAGLYNTNNVPSQMQKIQEKRAPVSVLEDESNVAKRRLVKTRSVPGEKSMENRESGSPAASDDKGEEPNVGPTRGNLKEPVADDEGETSDRFDNPKEKQCWDMYRKMSEKGLAISYDTILRGMLTPTEYRLRRKPSIVPEDNCEITQN